MDDALIDAYLNQDTLGNRVGGTFTTHAYDNILKELKEKFPDKPIDKDKIQNRMKNIKRIWYPCYDLFKYGASGFGWNPATEMFTAKPEVWQRLIEVKPEAAEWKNKLLLKRAKFTHHWIIEGVHRSNIVQPFCDSLLVLYYMIVD